MKKLHQFILKSYAGPLVLTFFIALFVLVMNFVWKYVDDLVGKGLAWDVVAELLFYGSLTFVPMALPISILLASIMTFGNLGERYELAAIKASGISLRTMITPLIILSVAISLFAFYFSNTIFPYVNLKHVTILYDIRQQKLSFNIREGIFYDDIEGLNLRIGKKETDGKTIRDVIIYNHMNSSGNLNVTVAKTGEMTQSADSTILELRLFDGYNYVEKIPRTSDMARPFQRTSFREQYQKFDLSDFKLRRSDDELFRNHYRMMKLQDLDKATDSIQELIQQRSDNLVSSTTYSYVAQQKIRPKDVDSLKMLHITSKPITLNELPKRRHLEAYELAISQIRNNESNVDMNKSEFQAQQEMLRKHQIEWHKKFTLSIACLLMFFIGAPLGAIIRKGGLGMPLVVSIFLFVLYHVFSIIGEKAAKEGNMSPELGTWLSSLVFLPLGIFFMYKAATDSQLLDAESWKKFFRRKKVTT